MASENSATQIKFFDACRDGSLTAKDVKAILEDPTAGVSIEDRREPQGWTPLIQACFGEQLDIVRLLLDLNADANATNHKGTTPIMYAKTAAWKSKRTDLLTLLLDHGADINRKDLPRCWTVLDYVIEDPNSEGRGADSKWLIDFFRGKGAKRATEL